jgi:hypothetical protein
MRAGPGHHGNLRWQSLHPDPNCIPTCLVEMMMPLGAWRVSAAEMSAAVVGVTVRCTRLWRVSNSCPRPSPADGKALVKRTVSQALAA